MNNGYVQGENLLESPDTVERQKTPDHNRKTGVIHGVYKKLVSMATVFIHCIYSLGSFTEFTKS